MLSTALGGCFIPASNAVLQASLSSAFFSLRQIVILSALGMNALQSLSTSGVQAKRCSSVPCENEGSGEATAHSTASDTRHCVKGVSRSSIHLFRLSTFIRGPAIRNRSRYSTSSCRYKYTLAGARTCSETSAFVAFDPAAVLSLPESGNAEHRAECEAVRSGSTSGAHKPPSHRTSVQALGIIPTLTCHVEMMRGR